MATATSSASKSISISGPLLIWDALLRSGASAVQAAGIMGNMIAESSLNPEAINSAGPQAGVGLVQWQTTDYPAVPMPTGNTDADIQSQVAFLAQTGGLQAASGTTVAETAGNFAANYERCSSCQPGGSQYTQRIANAQQVASWASSGSWPSDLGTAATQAQLSSAATAELTSAEQSAQQNCAWGISSLFGISAGDLEWLFDPAAAITSALGGSSASGGYVCLLTKPQIRAMVGSLILLGGVALTLAAVALIVETADFTVPALLSRAAGPVLAGMSSAGVRTEPRPASVPG